MFKISLAPIRGITDSIMRSALSRHFGGIDFAVAPFVRLDQKPSAANILRDLAPQKNTQLPVVPQILGNNPTLFLSMASRLKELGYSEVNWNLGCPFPTAVKKNHGAGLLAQPEKIFAFLDEVLPGLSLSLSVKARLGLKDPADLEKLFPRLNNYPLKKIVIHPRTASQMYEGTIDLKRFQVLLGLTTHPVVYNGDITDVSTFKNLVEKFPTVQGWMIGRGLLTNPYLGTEIKTGKMFGREERLQKLILFHQDIYSRYRKQQNGPAHFLDKMRGIWSYLGEFIEADHKFFKRLRKIKKIVDYDALIDEGLSRFTSHPT